MSNLKDAFSAEAFRARAHKVVDFLADKLTESQHDPNQLVNDLTDPESSYAEVCQMFKRLGVRGTPKVPAETEGSDGAAQQVDENRIIDLFSEVYDRSIKLHNPRYMGHQISPVLPAACLASLMGDFLNNGMGVFEMGVSGTAIERFVIKSLAKKIGFPEQADGYITSGGTLGNLTAMLAARRAKASHNVWKDGTNNRLAIMVSDQAHYCMDKAARVMGWGDEGIILIKSDDTFRMKVDTLETQLQTAKEKGIEVIAVVGSACSTATGSFDDLVSIGGFCQKHDLWFHVDGAHGAATVYSSEFKHLVNGIELADSVTMDFHKLLLTPALATGLVFKDGRFAAQNFAQKADYLWDESDESANWHDLAKRTFECTKSMVGFKVFTIMAMHGESIFDENVTAVYKSARMFADLIEQQTDFELATNPESNIVCFRYSPSRLSSKESSTDISQLNATIRSAIVQEGKFYIVQTKLNGEVWLRTTIANAFTAKEHFLDLFKAIRKTSHPFQ